MVLDLRDDLQRDIWWSGQHWEHPAPAVISAWTSGATHFFDVGANFGFFSLVVASASPQVEVHAFEPTAHLATTLEQTAARNRLAHVHVHPIGLSDRADRLQLHLGRDSTGHSTFGPHPELSGHGPAIEVLPFDMWRREAGLALPARPSWVAKIDVEGFELRVLHGMAEALHSRAFLGLVVELNEWTLEFCGSSSSEVRELLDGCGYRPAGVDTGDHFNAFFIPS